MHTLTHTHACTYCMACRRQRIIMHGHMHECTRTHMHARTHACTHTCTHACKRTHMHARMRVRVYTITHARTRMQAHVRTFAAHVHTHSHLYSHAHVHRPTHAHRPTACASCAQRLLAWASNSAPVCSGRNRAERLPSRAFRRACARGQTVSDTDEPFIYQLLSLVGRATG